MRAVPLIALIGLNTDPSWSLRGNVIPRRIPESARTVVELCRIRVDTPLGVEALSALSNPALGSRRSNGAMTFVHLPAVEIYSRVW